MVIQSMSNLAERLRSPVKGLRDQLNKPADQGRRQLLIALAMAPVSGVLQQVPLLETQVENLVGPEGTPEQSNSSVEKEPVYVHSKLGMHLHPDIDGETNPIWKNDVERITPTYVVVLVPGDREIPPAKIDQLTWLVEKDIAPVVRFYTNDNMYSQTYGTHIRTTIQRIQEETRKNDILFQVFNEVNLRHEETRNRYISPEAHMRDHFIPAANIITGLGGIAVLTPPAPRGDCRDEHGQVITAQAYLERMLVEAKRQWNPERLGKLVVAIHPYVFEESGSLVEEIRSYHQAAQNALGANPRIIVTETNALLTSLPHVTAETRARVLRNMLAEELPQDLDNVIAICLFPWTNDFSRRSDRLADNHDRLMGEMAIRKSHEDSDPNNDMLRAVLEAKESVRKTLGAPV